MNEEIRNKISNEEQQLYIDAKLELAALERKIVVEDNDYQGMIDDLNNTTDLDQKERLAKHLEGYISVSEYNRLKKENLDWINEINAKYGLNESLNLSVEGLRARQQLTRLRGYYRRRNMNILDHLSIETLSDEEAIREFRSYTSNISPDVLKEMLNDDIRSRLNRSDDITPVEPGNNNGGTPDGDENAVDMTEINTKVGEFNSLLDDIKKSMKEIVEKLTLGDINDLNVKDSILELGTKIAELRDMRDGILNKMDEIRLQNDSVQFNVSSEEINKTVDDISNGFKDLKVLHQTKYNDRVDWINNKIDEFKGMSDLSDEVKTLVDALQKLDRSDNSINDWQQKNYLDNIDYDKLVAANKSIDEIQNKLGLSVDSEVFRNLSSEIDAIEGIINGIEDEIKSGLIDADFARINQDLKLISDRVKTFNLALADKKDHLSDDEYIILDGKRLDVQERIMYLDDRLKALKDFQNNNKNTNGNNNHNNNNNNNDYDELRKRLEFLVHDISLMSKRVNKFSGHVDEDGKNNLLSEFNGLTGELNAIEKDLTSKKSNMEKSQADTLETKINEAKAMMNEIEGKINDPKFVKGADVFTVLNDRINKLGGSISKLKSLVEAASKPIKRNDRKLIDDTIKKIEKEISNLELNLEYYKDEDLEKYKVASERLNELKNEFNDVCSKYREKCPLLVRGVKSAKNFYKKHKKGCLIAAGLAAMALVVGPVLIPSIIHGNMMIWQSAPALRPFIEFTNNILGGIIGASQPVKNAWVLRNGVCVNASCAASSLLKGLAISGIGSTALVAPLVIMIKNLVGKMNKAELKEKMSQNIDKFKEKTNKASEEKKKKKKEKDFDKLYLKFISGNDKDIDKFCEKNNLDENEKKEFIKFVRNKLDDLRTQVSENVEQNVSGRSPK